MKRIDIKTKEIKGITLIALVITIVVLIILAAVAINLSLGNNGIFNRAKTAKEQYQNAQAQEQTTISSYSNQIDIATTRGEMVSINSEEYNNLKMMNCPTLWIANTETDNTHEYNFGNGIYGCRKKGTITINAKAYSTIVLSGDKTINNIISYGGSWTARQVTNDVLIMNANVYDGAQASRIMLYPESDGLVFSSTSAYARTNAPYDIWVLYTKSVD